MQNSICFQNRNNIISEGQNILGIIIKNNKKSPPTSANTMFFAKIMIKSMEPEMQPGLIGVVGLVDGRE